jgi:hypothetical protein
VRSAFGRVETGKPIALTSVKECPRVTDLDKTMPKVLAPEIDRVICRDSIDRVLLDAAAYALRGHGCHHLDHLPVLGRHRDLPEPMRQDVLKGQAWAAAVPADTAGRMDTDAVADWIVSHYAAPTYPALVLGSPHGGAVHLAAALGAPWLPTSFTVTVRWPDGAVDDWGGALDWGATVAVRILAANPTVTVRQVHDPLRRGPLCASTVTLHVRWRQLPPAYRAFVQDRLEPGAASLLLRDVRTWPAFGGTPGYSFQVGSPVGGWEPPDYSIDNPSFAQLIRGIGGDRWSTPRPESPRRYAEPAGEPELERSLRQAGAEARRPTHRVLYPTPGTLSSCVADLYREWLPPDRRGGDRCVVETERLLDPWQVLTTGLVPYWCESASRRAVSGAEWWVAGSSRFDSVDVLPAPPGSAVDANAGLGQWRAIASFARYRGDVSPEALRRYPLLPLPTSYAATVLQAQPRRRPAPSRLRMVEALSGLRRTGHPLGMLVL